MSELNVTNLKALIKDLVPQDGQQPLLNDSRRASSYAAIVTNETALRILRNTSDYETAFMVAQGSSVNIRLRKISMMLDTVDTEVNGAVTVDEDTLKLLNVIQKRVVGLTATVKYTLAEKDIEND